jgi:hypothetical protein
MSADLSAMREAILDAAFVSDTHDLPDPFPAQLDCYAAAVRRSAITEAVDRLTDEQVYELSGLVQRHAAMRQWIALPLDYDGFRAALRRALTEGT